MSGQLDYKKNKSKQKDSLKLAMAMLVKDEVDIIEKNIKYHANQGVDAFFIMDNYSTDGTYEALENLKESFRITLFRTDKYAQAKDMSFLTHTARKMGYDWVIENDADEFWCPVTGNLKDVIDNKKTVISASRYNVVPCEASSRKGHPVFFSKLRVKNPIDYDWTTAYEENKNINYVLARADKKVMVNAHGFIEVKFGNHRAKHSAMKWPYRVPTESTSNINVYHFMVRDLQRFKQRTQTMNKNYQSGSMSVKKGQAWYWNGAFENNEVEDLFQKMVISDSVVEGLLNSGVIEFDEKIPTLL